MTTRETFFITGFPGFIATRLVAGLARLGSQFVLLVQPAFVERARSEIARLAEATGRDLISFTIVEGDISKQNLGLSGQDLEMARDVVTRVFHLAAMYDLAVARQIAQQINVEGTKNVNSFVRSLRRLRHYHHVSTCYVAGKREGRIFETELRHESGFRNFYEESKYLAELEVESMKSEVPITIHRPAVVCGDSTTGETAKYDGVYYLILYLLRWPNGLSLLNIGNHEVSLNLVPIDFVVKAMVALAFDAAAIGKTLQLADPNPLTTNQLFNTISQSISGRKSKITVPPSWVEFLLMLPLHRALHGFHTTLSPISS